MLKRGLLLGLLAIVGITGLTVATRTGGPARLEPALVAAPAAVPGRSQQAWRDRNHALQRALELQAQMVTAEAPADSQALAAR